MLVFAAISGFLAVAMGAFGAHGLKSVLSPEMLTVYQTGVFYHLTHSIIWGVVALAAVQWPSISWLNRSAWAFALGIVLFSGSLYLLTLTGVKTLGMVTPFGGVSLLVGWFMLAMAGKSLAKVKAD